MKDFSKEQYLEWVEQITSESEPMKLTDMMVDSPCKVICCSYFILIVFGAIAVMAGYVIPELGGDGRGREFNIWLDPLQVDADMLTLANDYVKDTSGDPVVALQTESTNFNFLLYTNKGDKEFGLLDKEVLKAIQTLENDYKSGENYKNFCLAKNPKQPGDTPECDATMEFSVLNSILGPKGMPGSLDLETATQEQINTKFSMHMKSPFWK